ncbi:type II toxin-antitoxin system PemK/MazF family toxin [Criblamydia sequanensis]|uniref:type II toxin-antitoxin system PemK/MazF family toxin n=1 Tax=Candidatus Criblamydia sequanensis TaxID=340071 RepID=UPI001378BB99
MRETSIKKGGIYSVDFYPVKEPETKKRRQAVICSRTLFNNNSKKVILPQSLRI